MTMTKKNEFLAFRNFQQEDKILIDSERSEKAAASLQLGKKTESKKTFTKVAFSITI